MALINQPSGLILRGKPIREDGEGRLCLDDIFDLSGAKESKAPKHWRGNRASRELQAELQKKVTAGYLKDGKPNSPVIHAGRGRGVMGTYAHPILAAAYAGYLSPKLEIEVREIWLRFRAGDATLADEILQRASVEANHWAGVRALARSNRNGYTDVLKEHGVVEKGYMACTEAVYQALLGGKSYELRARRGLPDKTNLRDHMNVDELSYVMAAEALSAERIEEEDRQGNADCVAASRLGASAIRSAIEADRRNRQKRLMG
ncbi:KilA-N domain-containing protein [Sphingomonas mali]|uniref:KilA-N domain-containing protein n=1 Tax=Sphingomonas mali TaxID=40682 RepID=UPI000A06F089|nr:KilA-N domain-containing protein [Sphingomonas mali]